MFCITVSYLYNLRRGFALQCFSFQLHVIYTSVRTILCVYKLWKWCKKLTLYYTQLHAQVPTLPECPGLSQYWSLVSHVPHGSSRKQLCPGNIVLHLINSTHQKKCKETSQWSVDNVTVMYMKRTRNKACCGLNLTMPFTPAHAPYSYISCMPRKNIFCS